LPPVFPAKDSPGRFALILFPLSLEKLIGGGKTYAKDLALGVGRLILKQGYQYLEGFTKKQCSSRHFVVVAIKLLGEELLLVERH
jgi:hypothetical protein